MNKQTLADEVKLMKTAFELVQSKEHWKAPIAAYLTPAQLENAGVSLDDVREAVTFYTGTTATIRFVGGFHYVTAPGYWAGPCN